MRDKNSYRDSDSGNERKLPSHTRYVCTYGVSFDVTIVNHLLEMLRNFHLYIIFEEENIAKCLRAHLLTHKAFKGICDDNIRHSNLGLGAVPRFRVPINEVVSALIH